MVTTEQKPIVNTQKRKGYKHITKESCQATEEEARKEERNHENSQKAIKCHRCIPISNYFNYKCTKFSNQKASGA